MKSAEIIGLNDPQLIDLLQDTQRRLFKLRFQAATEKLEAPSEMKKLRKDIARIKTLQRQREIAAESAAAKVAPAPAPVATAASVKAAPTKGTPAKVGSAKA